MCEFHVVSDGAATNPPSKRQNVPRCGEHLQKISPEEREINRLQSKIRVRVENVIRGIKTRQIMDDRYRNPLIKYDRINGIMYGLVS